MIFVANWKMHGNFNDISKVKTVLNLIKNGNFGVVRTCLRIKFPFQKVFQ